MHDEDRASADALERGALTEAQHRLTPDWGGSDARYGRSVVPDRFRTSSQPRVGISTVPSAFRSTSAPRLPR
jgi:hypothetical protein